jgi:hypothetical protein
MQMLQMCPSTAVFSLAVCESPDSNVASWRKKEDHHVISIMANTGPWAGSIQQYWVCHNFTQRVQTECMMEMVSPHPSGNTCAKQYMHIMMKQSIRLHTTFGKRLVSFSSITYIPVSYPNTKHQTHKAITLRRISSRFHWRNDWAHSETGRWKYLAGIKNVRTAEMRELHNQAKRRVTPARAVGCRTRVLNKE